MATLHYNAQGAILRRLLTPDQEAAWPDPPAGAVGALQFDEDTNPGVAARLRADSTPFAVVGGALQEAGAPVTLAADGNDRTQRQQLDTWAAATQTYLGLNTPTAAQTTAQVQRNARALAFVLRRLRGAL